MNNKITAAIILLIGLLSACVPQRKFQDMEVRKDELLSELTACQNDLSTAQSGSEGYLEEIKILKKDNKQLQADTTVKGERYRSIQKLNREMERLCEKIRIQNEQLVSQSSSEKKEMTEALSSTQAALNKREHDLLAKEREMLGMQGDLQKQERSNQQLQDDLKERETRMNQLQQDLKVREQNTATLQAELEAREAKMNQLQGDLKDKEGTVDNLTAGMAEREKRVAELEAAINRQKDQATALRTKLSQALLGFSAAELSVEQRNGKVYVSLSQELLYKTGSKTIDPKGKKALASLAGVLNKNPEINIMIEGHTDDVGEANSNWDLSVMRATSVVRELTSNSVDPKRITASGKGEFYPVANNSTAAGKAENRRTEIILSPKFSDLYDILK